VDVRVAAELPEEGRGDDEVRRSTASSMVVAATLIASRTCAGDWLEAAGAAGFRWRN
jgi:hypothetical protein